jgi:putative (di)nucleoside polyphosphate hydrolase
VARDPDPRLYRPNVGIMLLNSRGLVLVAQRIDTPGPSWQMPQGGVDDGEDLHKAALRELEEEIGTAHVTLVAEAPDWLYYDVPRELQLRLWGGKYLGQRQKWFLMRFEGENSEINIHTAHPEFSSWKWAVPQTLPDLAIDFKRLTYEKVLKGFQKYLAL